MVLATRDIRTLIDCVARLYSPPIGAFGEHVLAAVRDLVPADTRGWHLVEVTDGRASYPAPAGGLVSYVEDPPGAFNLAKTLSEMAPESVSKHPLIVHHVRTRGRGPATAISDLLAAREYRRLPLYSEFFQRFGIEDQLAVPVPESFPQLAGVSFQRSTRSFTARDRLVLDLIAPHLSRAQRNAAALARAHQLSAGLEAVFATRRAGILVLSANGRVETASAGALALAAAHFGPPERLRELPAKLRGWVSRARALPGGDAMPPPLDPLVHDGTAGRIVVRLLPRAADGSDVVVLEEGRNALVPAALAPLGLSRRETEVLTWVANGKSNAEIAVILGIAVPTVKKHLEHVYTKLGVENRQAAATRGREIASLGSGPFYD